MSEKKRLDDLTLMNSIDNKSSNEDGLIRYQQVFDTSQGE